MLHSTCLKALQRINEGYIICHVNNLILFFYLILYKTLYTNQDNIKYIVLKKLYLILFTNHKKLSLLQL